MNKKIQERFIYSAAVILFITAAAKLLNARSPVLALDGQDPLLLCSHRQVFYMMGGIELAVSAFLLAGLDAQLKLMLVAWLATIWLIHRIGLEWTGIPNLGNCPGNLADYLPLSPRLINIAALVTLGWLIAGSYLFLILGWVGQRRKKNPRAGIVLTSEPVT